MAFSKVQEIPQEILQKIASYAIHGSPLGPPRELHSLLLTCKTFKSYLSPQNASELHCSVFGQQFDILAPQCRLGQTVTRENTALELSRRFVALQISKKTSFEDHSLTEALWIAYLMVEDQDTSQKNVQQLIRAGFPAFLDSYLLNHLYDGSAENNGWPVMTEQNSLALALAWNLASDSSIRREDSCTRQEMIRLLEPIVFGASRYSIFRMPEDIFDTSKAPLKRKAWIPSGALFASLLYFARKEQITIKIPPHLTCKTRSEANLLGREGPCVDDIQHFFNNCRTHFAEFPAIDVSNLPADSSESSILGQTCYKLGTLNGPWQGSNILPSLEEYAEWRLNSKLPAAGSIQARKPLYFIFEEHYCYDPKAVVPQDDPANGMKNAWLPEDLEFAETEGGIDFYDSNGTFHAHYETFRHGQIQDQRQLVDVIITGKTDDQYSAAWGASSKILGRVRLTDGLIILGKTSHQWGLETETDQQMLRGYVTSSQNFVGRMKGSTQGAEPSSWEGVFSLNKSQQESPPFAGDKNKSRQLIRRTCFSPRLSPVQLAMNRQTSLLTVPQEIIENIAYFAATHTFLGPPSSLLPLLLVNRQINSCLSITTNHYLYARIFGYKFDMAAPLARFGADRLPSQAFAEELKRRCVVLKRLRARTDSTTRARHADKDIHKLSVHDVLFTSYILMLENDGKNQAQLEGYGQMKAWIREFWFDPRGASLAVYSIRTGIWPPDRPETALGMWLFWFLLNTEDYDINNGGPESPFNILKILALSAHRYGLTTTSWLHLEPQSTITLPPAEHGLLYSKSIAFNTPPLGTPAILSFLALINKKRSIPLPPSNSTCSQKRFQEWNCEWERCFTVASPKQNVYKCFRPGSMEGVWEGFFTYTEFAAFAALLAGASPNIIQKSVVGRHQQTWKLREYHLVSADDFGSDSGIDMDDDTVNPLSPGDPLSSYFPTGTQLKEHRDGLTVQEPGCNRALRYQRASSIEAQKLDNGAVSRVKDIIITGEGHSAWGQSNLTGRVRPCDGFVSLSKEYIDGDRGKWLYRGYLVGNTFGSFAGRWRDTLTPAHIVGYEGSFAMSRRR